MRAANARVATTASACTPRMPQDIPVECGDYRDVMVIAGLPGRPVRNPAAGSVPRGPRTLLFAGCIIMAAIAPGCTRIAGSGTPAQAHPQTLRVLLGAEPRTLNPLLQLNDYEYFVTHLAFDLLVDVDASGNDLVPRLAREVPTRANRGISADGKTIVWHLRPGVKWQDGEPFTSADVKFSFDAVMNPANDVANRRGFDLVRDVSTPDELTVVVRLREPFAPAVSTFFGGGDAYAILPAHAFAHVRDFNTAAFGALPVGTGPFRITRWLRGQEIDLVANDGYFGGKPALRKIVVSFVPAEPTAIDQMRTHEGDVLAVASIGAYRQLSKIAGVHVALTPNHGASTIVMNTTREPLNDVRVRRAIVAAIDKRTIAQKVTGGAADPATEDLPSFMWAFSRAARAQRFDPAGARALLASAGYVAGADGILEKNGKRLELVLAYTENSIAARSAVVLVQSYLQAAGIAITIKGYDGGQFFGPFAAGGILQSGNYDLAWYTMTLGIDPDSSGRFTCAAIPPAGQNYSRYCSPEMDAAESAALRSSDRPARVAAYARTQALLARDAPIDFVYWPRNVDAFDARLHGFAPNPLTASWNAQRWSF
jgi:peptide/nickel transport system substrate-binding protein